MWHSWSHLVTHLSPSEYWSPLSLTVQKAFTHVKVFWSETDRLTTLIFKKHKMDSKWHVYWYIKLMKWIVIMTPHLLGPLLNFQLILLQGTFQCHNSLLHLGMLFFNSRTQLIHLWTVNHYLYNKCFNSLNNKYTFITGPCFGFTS